MVLSVFLIDNKIFGFIACYTIAEAAVSDLVIQQIGVLKISIDQIRNVESLAYFLLGATFFPNGLINYTSVPLTN